jgi:YfiR/HmsC-like
MSVVPQGNYRYVQRVGTASLRLRFIICGLVAAAVLCAGPLRAQSASEYEIKAAFLYKFASFVQWPAGVANSPPGSPPAGANPICIGVLGADRFGPFLDHVVRGKLVGGREFAVERFHSAGQALHCEIVFISGSEQSRMREILEAFRGRPVLTVSEVPGFCELGGSINLRLIDAAIRFEINVAAGERAGLRFSSKLLSLARIVPEVSP